MRDLRLFRASGRICQRSSNFFCNFDVLCKPANFRPRYHEILTSWSWMMTDLNREFHTLLKWIYLKGYNSTIIYEPLPHLHKNAQFPAFGAHPTNSCTLKVVTYLLGVFGVLGGPRWTVKEKPYGVKLWKDGRLPIF